VRRPFQFFALGRKGPPTAVESLVDEISKEDRDRFAAEEAAADQASLDIRNLLRDQVQFVYADGMSFANELSWLDDEKDFLNRQEQGLARGQVELDRAVSRVTSPRLRYAIYRAVYDLVWHGANMARFARPFDAIERAQARQEEERRKREAVRRGKASVKSRRAKAVAGWHKEALRLAKQIRGLNPTLSQEALAVQIGDTWNETDLRLPTRETRILFIRESEKKALLPRRNTGRKL
jgi:hypothetical protein